LPPDGNGRLFAGFGTSRLRSRDRLSRPAIVAHFLPATGFLLSTTGASPGLESESSTSVNRFPIDLDGDGAPELDLVETLLRYPAIPQPFGTGPEWSRDLTFEPREGVFIRADPGIFGVRVLWPESADPQGDHPQWTSSPVSVCSVGRSTVVLGGFGRNIVSVIGGGVANIGIPSQAFSASEPHNVFFRVGEGAEARQGWVTLRFQGHWNFGPQPAGDDSLKVRLEGFGLGQPGEPLRVGVDNRFRPVRFERGEAGPRLVLDTVALWNGVEAAPFLGSTNWTPVNSSEAIDPSVSARFYRFAP
jgi:hypothetical protein